MYINVDRGVACLKPGRVVQSGYASGYRCVSIITAEPGVASHESILAWSHTFVEVDQEIISTATPPPPLIQEG